MQHMQNSVQQNKKKKLRKKKTNVKFEKCLHLTKLFGLQM